MNDGYMIGRDENGLTRREREVIAGLRAGKARNRIATDLGISRQRVAQILESIAGRGINPDGVQLDSDVEARRQEAAAADSEAGIREDPL